MVISWVRMSVFTAQDCRIWRHTKDLEPAANPGKLGKSNCFRGAGREAWAMAMWLAMQTIDGDERRFQLQKPQVVLGRDPWCDLRVAVPSVADRHCEIRVEGDGVRLRDLGSPAGCQTPHGPT